jgi:hypothetical protein
MSGVNIFDNRFAPSTVFSQSYGPFAQGNGAPKYAKLDRNNNLANCTVFPTYFAASGNGFVLQTYLDSLEPASNTATIQLQGPVLNTSTSPATYTGAVSTTYTGNLTNTFRELVLIGDTRLCAGTPHFNGRVTASAPVFSTATNTVITATNTTSFLTQGVAIGDIINIVRDADVATPGVYVTRNVTGVTATQITFDGANVTMAGTVPGTGFWIQPNVQFTGTITSTYTSTSTTDARMLLAGIYFNCGDAQLLNAALTDVSFGGCFILDSYSGSASNLNFFPQIEAGFNRVVIMKPSAGTGPCFIAPKAGSVSLITVWFASGVSDAVRMESCQSYAQIFCFQALAFDGIQAEGGMMTLIDGVFDHCGTGLHMISCHAVLNGLAFYECTVQAIWARGGTTYEFQGNCTIAATCVVGIEDDDVSRGLIPAGVTITNLAPAVASVINTRVRGPRQVIDAAGAAVATIKEGEILLNEAGGSITLTLLPVVAGEDDGKILRINTVVPATGGAHQITAGAVLEFTGTITDTATTIRNTPASTTATGITTLLPSLVLMADQGVWRVIGNFCYNFT